MLYACPHCDAVIEILGTTAAEVIFCDDCGRALEPIGDVDELAAAAVERAAPLLAKRQER